MTMMDDEKEKTTIQQSESPSNCDFYVNPFFHRINMGTLDIVRVAVMSVTIAPIRLFMAGFTLLLMWPMAALFCWGRAKEQAGDTKTYFSTWKLCLRPFVMMLCRAVFFWGGFHWIRVKGRRATAQEAPIVSLAPHSSYFDALFVVFLDLPSIVAKAENKKLPIFGTVIDASEPVYVAREDPNSRISTIQEIKRRCDEPGKWPQILLFPEGTCTNRTCLISFKGGAFYPAVPVQPVCIRYLNKLDTTSWTWDGPGAFKVLWLTLCQIHNDVEVEFLPPYVPTGEELTNAKLFGNNVREAMAKSMGIPVTNHTYDDCRLRTRATNNNLPLPSSVIDFYKLHEDLGFSFGGVQRLYKKIAGMCKNGSNKVDINKFAEYLGIPISESLRSLYTLYNPVDGLIDIREYIVTLALVSGPESTYEILHMAFCLFAIDEHIRLEHMVHVLGNIFGTTKENVTEYFKLMDGDRDGTVTFDEMMRVISGQDEYHKYFHDDSPANGGPVLDLSTVTSLLSNCTSK